MDATFLKRRSHWVLFEGRIGHLTKDMPPFTEMERPRHCRWCSPTTAGPASCPYFEDSTICMVVRQFLRHHAAELYVGGYQQTEKGLAENLGAGGRESAA